MTLPPTARLAGDIVAQKVAEGRETIDYRRLAAFTVFGAGWTGLYNHWWYGTLARWYPGVAPMTVVKKLAWNHGASSRAASSRGPGGPTGPLRTPPRTPSILSR